jgi:hypothetical protein
MVVIHRLMVVIHSLCMARLLLISRSARRQVVGMQP